MPIKPPHSATLLVIITFILMLNSCGTTPPSTFYLLEPMPENEAIQASADSYNEIHIGIGPIQFAEYLDRTQIVTRTDATRVKLAETHRWAEPLRKNFARILAQNLSMLINTGRVSLYPSRNWSEVDYQVLVNVWQFDASRQGEVSLVANWSIRGKGGADFLTMKQSIFSAHLEPAASYADIVRALSKTVELLSREIAEAIREKQK